VAVIFGQRFVVVIMIVITGEKGVGKTALLKKVIEQSEKDFYGIISERFDTGYYVEDVKTGKKKILCLKSGPGFKFRNYYFDPAAFIFIKESLKRRGEILVYDEIGYLEVEEKINIWDYMKEPAILIVRKDLVDFISSRFDTVVFEVKKGDKKQLQNILEML
jgi:nucleoside-triphosphatase THEP1